MNRLSTIFNPAAGLLPRLRLNRDAIHPRLVLMGAGIIMYGVFGSPTPEHISPALAVCAVLLIAALPLGGNMPVLWPGHTMPLAHDAGLLFIYYGLSMPLMTSLLGDHALYGILRDMIWMGMMGLPLLYVYSLKPGRNNMLRFFHLLAIAGWLFAARVILTPWVDMLQLLDNAPILYLPNSPLVMFAALWLGGNGLARLTYAPYIRSALGGGVMVCLALVPVAAMMSVLQRASFGVLVLGLVLFTAGVLVRAPGRLWRVIAILGGAAMLLEPVIHDVYMLLLAKTREVGLNMRMAEAWTILQHSTATPLTPVFGHGWGATYISPAVGDEPVGYTHSLMTFLLFKTGIVGLVLGGSYITALLLNCTAWLRQWPVLAYSLSMPVLVHSVLYANHKSFGFAMLLVGLALAGFSYRRGDDISVEL